MNDIHNEISDENLIEIALTSLNPRTPNDGDTRVGSVAAALQAIDGNIYTGVCIDTNCGMGFCAEHSAIAAMITAGGIAVIGKIVAVAQKNKNADTYIYAPCGRCRQFMKEIDPKNLHARIILSTIESHSLLDLLPFHNWKEPVV